MKSKARRPQFRRPIKKMRFVWIDDSPEREGESKNLAERIDVEIKFISVKDMDIEKVLSDLTKSDEPDLILMDHSLDRTESESFRTGSTATSFIHEIWHECPVICITGVDPEGFDSRQKSAYEEIYSFSSISNYDETLKSIAAGFKKLKGDKPKGLRSLMKHLKAPEEDCEKIVKVLPKEVKENLLDKSFLLEVYRWLSTTLFSRPGFLYDRLWVSTLLGLTEEGFTEVESIFDRAKYSGVFADSSKERWWKSEVLTILGGQVDEIKMPWELGRKLQGVTEQHYSRCYTSEEYFPETVAYEDMATDAKRAPMKLKYTVPHPNFENLLFFEEIRIMKPAE